MADGTSPISYNAARGPCAVCGAEGLPCARCRLDYYCSKQHQREHWVRHKAGCGALELRTDDPVLGRYLAAAKDIPAGTVILRDSPLLLVPRIETPLGEVYCAACCSGLGRRWAGCARCGWPVCGAACSEATSHLSECQAFQRAEFKLKRGDVERCGSKLWMALGALKTLNASETEPRIRDLQGDFVDPDPAVGVVEGSPLADLREAVAEMRSQWRGTARWLRDEAGLRWLPEDDLYHAAGRNYINALSVVTDPAMEHMRALLGKSDGQGGAGALYCGISLLQHDCSPSATHVVDSPMLESQASGARVVMAARDVRRGEHLSIDYLDCPLQDTAARRRRLLGWGFICQCDLCSDPTERGQYTGSVCCKACTGLKNPRFVVNEGAVTERWGAGWRCEECGLRVSEGRDQPGWQEEQELSALLDAGGTRAAEVERFLEDNLWPRGRLHPTHRLVLDAKNHLVTIMTPELAMATGLPPKARMQRVVRLCRDLLSALDASGRGLCTRRANLLMPLIVASKLALRSDMLPYMAPAAEATRPSLGTAAALGQLRSFAPQVREIEKWVKQLEPMNLPAEKAVLDETHRPELDMLLLLTGCRDPTMGDIATSFKALGMKSICNNNIY